MITREEFMNEMKNRVQDEFNERGIDVEVSATKITKNNGTAKWALGFTGGGRNIQPTIYMEHYYDKCMNDEMTLAQVTDSVCDIYVSTIPRDDFNVESILDYEQAKDHITVCVRNAEMNSELLKTVPHDIMGDLAVMYRVEVSNGIDGEGSVLINNQIMGQYGIDQDTLREQAWKNTKELHPYSFKSMGDVMREMFSGNGMDMPDDVFQQVDSNPGGMYVLSNDIKVNGAAYLCDTETLGKISDMIHDDLVILPSSIHECIVLPAKMCENMQMLKEMVETVNATEVAQDEILSPNVYKFDGQTHEISVYTGETQNMGQGMNM